MTTTDYVPHHGNFIPTQTLNPLLRQRVCFDGGNRTTCWINAQGKIQVIPSIIKNLADWEEAEADQSSIVIEFQGQRYVVGELAKHLGGRPVFERDKCELALLLALVALEPNPGQNVVSINELLIALPDKRQAENLKALQRLETTHEFIRNGQHVVASVRKVQAVDETAGAYALARRHGLLRDPSRTNGIIDFGGGTSIARLYTPTGTLNRKADRILPGTADLASQIDAALLSKTGASQDLGLIMDGIADGSFEIGTTGINFEAIFQGLRDEWLNEIRDRIKRSWVEYLPKIGEVLMIGGSAPLASPLEVASKGRFKIAPHSQLFNLKGMEVL